MLILSFLIAAVLLAFVPNQATGQNPTPILITLTPAPTGTPADVTATPAGTATATPGGIGPDRLEPNDEPASASVVGWQTEPDLSLVGEDVDYFTGYLKAGQSVSIQAAARDNLDTHLTLLWDGQIAAENDDISATELGSEVTFTAPADGWFLVRVMKGGPLDGRYDLTVALAKPTETPTPAATGTPTMTPTPEPTATPLIAPDAAEPNDTPASARPLTPGVQGNYTLSPEDVDYFAFLAKAGQRIACETETAQVDTLLTVHGAAGVIGSNDDRGPGRVDSRFEWTAETEEQVIVEVRARGGTYGAYMLVCAAGLPVPPPPPMPLPPTPFTLPVGATATPVTGTIPVTATEGISLTVRYAGKVMDAVDEPVTVIRLLIYYDADNDRAPGPGEGIPDVSVLVVDAQGQQLARIFTNAQGEAAVNVMQQTAARLIVPFVPGWSAEVRVGETNEITLGLPAVRLPIFFPVADAPAGEEQ
jgi:hypothetical protein